ncbi:MAG: DegT/DnrJ/EryC1/StrS aminotransferase family protein [Thermaerobacter sp.]|nr:DegT/DnrJ/EryC1/StrS aminotransferase family protein [Thermaerobacter sp.]
MSGKREQFLPYCLPDITDEEVAEVVAALRSGWLAKGPRTHEFEKQFAAYVGAKYAVGMNSCTAALHIALVAAGIGPGDEVITSPMTFAASANTIIHVGAKPVFVDIDADTGCIDPQLIEEAVTARTKAIVPIHYAGQSCDLDAIYAIAHKHNLFVSEDAAHGLDTEYKGRLIGHNAPGAVSYSFYATKNICTGEGGMLTTDDERLADRARTLVTHGMSKNAWNRYTKGGSWRYDIEEPGFKYNMFDLQAALGIVQLRRLTEMQTKRTQVAERYNSAFSKLDFCQVPTVKPYTTRHSWHLYPLRLRPGVLSIDRDTFIERLNEHNIGTSVHFIPVHLMSAYRHRFGLKEGDFPVAEAWFNSVLSLPLYPTMTDVDVQHVIEAVVCIGESVQ